MRAMKVASLILFYIIAILSIIQAIPIPDSAGIVEMPPGAAYGGIPYGSITGMVADYYNGGRTNLPRLQQPLRPVYY